VAWYLHNIERVGLYFREWRYLEGARRELVIAQGRSYVRFVAELIEHARADGEIAADTDAKLTVLYILGAINSLHEWYQLDGPDSPAVVAALYADMAVSGLTGRRVRPGAVGS
jgi:hypothetical protein